MTTPYTIRERRANIAKLEAEAYLGQKDVLLQRLIDGDLALAEKEREQAAVARAGGRLLTSKLAPRIEDFRTPGMYQTVIDTGRLMQDVGGTEVSVWIAALAGDLGQEKLNDCWRLMLDAAGDNGRKAWQWQAEHKAGVGKYPDRSYEDPTIAVVMLHEAEAMLNWPIYRAAIEGHVYLDLWGQASDAEEVVLDTLARCAGIDTMGLIPTIRRQQA